MGEVPLYGAPRNLLLLFLGISQGLDFRVLAVGVRFEVSDFGVRSSGVFQISDFGFRCTGFRFRISGFRVGVPDFRLRVSDFGFRISGFGLKETAL